jgi:hypothetical protein
MSNMPTNSRPLQSIAEDKTEKHNHADLAQKSLVCVDHDCRTYSTRLAGTPQTLYFPSSQVFSRGILRDHKAL